MHRSPSAELRPDQRDEDSLMPYDRLDPILQAFVEEDRTLEEIVAQGFDRADVERVMTLVTRAEYKRRRAAPGLTITPRAFGKDRRFPIATDCGGRDVDLNITASHDSMEPGARITYTITVDWERFSGSSDPDRETRFFVDLDSRIRFDGPGGVSSGATGALRDAEHDPTFEGDPGSAAALNTLWTVETVSFGIIGSEHQRIITVVLVPGVNGGTLTFTAVVADAPLGTEPLLTTVSVDTSHNLHGNDRDDVGIDVVDLGLTSERTTPAPPETVDPGDTLTYDHTLTNAGPVEVTTTLTNVVPAGTTYVALGSDSLWTCADGAAAGSVCERPVTLPAGSLSTAQVPLVVPFVVRINNDHPLDTPIINDASLPNVSTVRTGGTAGDPNPGNNRTRIETSLSGPEPEFMVTKTASPDSIGAAGPITYTVVVENTGGVDLTSLTLLDQLVSFGAPVQTGAGDPTNAILDVGETWTFTGTYLVTAAVFTANGVGVQGQPDFDGDIDSTTTVLAVGPDGPLDPALLSTAIAVDQWAIPGAADISGPGAGAVGLRDTPGCGDFPATTYVATFDGPGAQILEVDFAPTNFHATGIEIYVSNETGFIILIELLDENGAGIGVPANQVYWSTVDTGPHPADTTPCPGVFRWTFPQTPFEVTSAWIYTDSPGPEQIDAVRLIGVTVAP